jgi:hypothetical protein
LLDTDARRFASPLLRRQAHQSSPGPRPAGGRVAELSFGLALATARATHADAHTPGGGGARGRGRGRGSCLVSNLITAESWRRWNQWNLAPRCPFAGLSAYPCTLWLCSASSSILLLPPKRRCTYGRFHTCRRISFGTGAADLGPLPRRRWP